MFNLIFFCLLIDFPSPLWVKLFFICDNVVLLHAFLFTFYHQYSSFPHLSTHLPLATPSPLLLHNLQVISPLPISILCGSSEKIKALIFFFFFFNIHFINIVTLYLEYKERKICKIAVLRKFETITNAFFSSNFTQ